MQTIYTYTLYPREIEILALHTFRAACNMHQKNAKQFQVIKPTAAMF